VKPALPSDRCPPDSQKSPLESTSDRTLPVTDSPRLPLSPLQVIGIVVALGERRETVFQELVFTRNTLEPIDKKSRRNYERLLLSETAQLVLMLIWKEDFSYNSDSITKHLTQNLPPKILTAHSLAVSLAKTPQEVAAINTSVRSIVIAAQSFGLIDRSPVFSRKVSLRGTSVLHEVMLRLSDDYNDIMKPVHQSALRMLKR
jgi:hypothetical protein